MRIKLHQGPTLTDATVAMIKSIDKSDLNFMHVIIIPDRFSLQCEKLILSLLGQKALFNVRVVNLTKFSIELLGKLGVNLADGQMLSSGEILLLTSRAIENCAKDFKVLKKGGIDFCYEVSKLIAQFKSSGVSADNLNDKAEGLAGNKYHDLALIYHEYERLLEGKLDANARLALVNGRLKNSNILSDTKIYFAQFDAFTKAGYDLIQTFVTCADEVNISLTHPLSIGNEYIYEKDIFQKVKKLAGGLGCFVEMNDNQISMTPQKEAIVKGLNSYQKVRCENKGFYNFYSCTSGEEEVESVAKLIRYLTFKGKKYRDIQIAVGGLSKLEGQIENIFNQYDIPYYTDSSVTADKTVLGNLICCYFETVIMGYGYDKLVDLLANPLVNENKLLIEKCLRMAISGKQRYKKYIEKDFENAEILTRLEQCKLPSEFGEVVECILEKCESKYSQMLDKLGEKGELKTRNINLQVAEIIKEACKVISKESEQPISLSEYFKLLTLLLSFKQVSTVPTYVDGVFVGDASESFFGECDTLIILDGDNLPALSTDNGLLSDDDLKLNFACPIEPTIKMLNRRARFKLFSLLTLAQRRLFVFARRLDEEGKKKEAPAYIKSLNEIFGQQEVKAGNIFFSRKSQNLEINLLSLPLKSKQSEGEKLYINKTTLAKPIDKLVFKSNRARVTQLEQYYSCPFKHFATYALGLKEFEIDQFQPRDVGNICHKGAELLIYEIIKKDCLAQLDKNNLQKFIDKNFEKILAIENLTEKVEEAVEKEALIKYIKNQMLVLFEDIVKELSCTHFKPQDIEYKFEQKLTEGNVSLIGKADRIDEQGEYLRIIDYKTGLTGNILKELMFGQKLQLFLYQKFASTHFNKKMGGVFYFNARFDYAKDDETKFLLKGLTEDDQKLIPLFDKNIEECGKSEIFSVYKGKKDGLYKGSAISKTHLQKLCDYAEKMALNAIKEIREGFVQPKPHAESCRACKYASLCGYEKSQGQRNLIKKSKEN